MAVATRKWRPPLHKRILKSAAAITAFSYFIAVLLRALYLTNRVEKHIPNAAAPYANGDKPMVIAFWHGRLAMQPFLNPKQRMCYVLISPHANGLLISNVVRRLGINTVYGSSNRGARGAVEGLLDMATLGHNVVFTPDGPRGPFQKAAKGAAFVAIKTGLPVVCYSFSATRYTRFKSWDRFMLPKPFGRIAYVVSEPLFLGKDDSETAIAQATATIEETLNRVTEQADIACGVTP